MRWSLCVVAAAALLVAPPLLAGDIVEVQKTPTLGQPSPDQALVYFVRPAFTGKAVKFWAFADDAVLGATKGKTFLWAQVSPGSHVFWSKGENVSALEMSVEGGETYYLKQAVRMGGFKARVKLEPMSESEAKEALGKCKYATLTEEGRQRGAEVAAKGLEKAREKAAKRSQGAEEESGDD